MKMDGSDSDSVSDLDLKEFAPVTPEEKAVKSASTNSITKWCLNKFSSYLDRKNKCCDLSTVSAQELNELLRQFYGGVKPREKTKGRSFTAASMISLRAGLRRHITDNLGRNMDIINDKQFLTSNQMFTAICKIYEADIAKTKRKVVIVPGDMKRLGNYFAEFANNATVLLEATWFYLAFFLGKRSKDGWARLTIDTYRLATDTEQNRYVYLAETDDVIDNSNKRMYGEGVQIFELYMNKRNPDSKRLFLNPLSEYNISDEIWYRNTHLGKNRLGLLMHAISKKAGLTQTYTLKAVSTSAESDKYKLGFQQFNIFKLDDNRLQSTSLRAIGEQRAHFSNVIAETLSIPNSGPQQEHSIQTWPTSSNSINTIQGLLTGCNTSAAQSADHHTRQYVKPVTFNNSVHRSSTTFNASTSQISSNACFQQIDQASISLENVSLPIHQIRIGCRKFKAMSPVTFKRDGIVFTLLDYPYTPLSLNPQAILKCRANMDFSKYPMFFLHLEDACMKHIKHIFRVRDEEFSAASGYELTKSLTIFTEPVSTDDIVNLRSSMVNIFNHMEQQSAHTKMYEELRASEMLDLLLWAPDMYLPTTNVLHEFGDRKDKQHSMDLSCNDIDHPEDDALSWDNQLIKEESDDCFVHCSNEQSNASEDLEDNIQFKGHMLG